MGPISPDILPRFNIDRASDYMANIPGVGGMSVYEAAFSSGLEIPFPSNITKLDQETLNAQLPIHMQTEKVIDKTIQSIEKLKNSFTNVAFGDKDIEIGIYTQDIKRLRDTFQHKTDISAFVKKGIDMIAVSFGDLSIVVSSSSIEAIQEFSDIFSYQISHYQSIGTTLLHSNNLELLISLRAGLCSVLTFVMAQERSGDEIVSIVSHCF